MAAPRTLATIGCILALIPLLHFSASPRPSPSRIFLSLNANPTASAAATNSVVNTPIFEQCIISKTEHDIPYGIGDFVAPQSSIFSETYINETMFRKAIFEKRINPWLVRARVGNFDCDMFYLYTRLLTLPSSPCPRLKVASWLLSLSSERTRRSHCRFSP